VVLSVTTALLRLKVKSVAVCPPSLNSKMAEKARLSLADAVRRGSIRQEKKKFSIVEFSAQQRSLAERVLGKWHSLVDDAHKELHKGVS
jgi:hypothetical protein